MYDFDGTLIDSAAASFRCYQEAFEGTGLSFDRARFAATYSPDWYQTYRALGIPPDAWPETDRRWMACYTRIATDAIPGAQAALERVQASGLRQALVTSASRERVDSEVNRLDWGRFFDRVVCAEDVTRKKPHPEGLLAALDTLDTKPRHAAYIGDSPEDIEMARAAGVFAIAIPGGFPNRDALQASAFDLIADNLELAIDSLLAGRAAGSP